MNSVAGPERIQGPLESSLLETKLLWFKQYLFMINLHIQYIIFYGTGSDEKLKLINSIS